MPVVTVPKDTASNRLKMWPPPADERIDFSVRGDNWEIQWGCHATFGTPAFWIDQTIHRDYIAEIPTGDLQAAVVWGLLHGSQVKGETGNAFYVQVVQLLAKDPLPTPQTVEAVLKQPIDGIGRYRWPHRAAWISEAVTRLAADPPPENPPQRIDYLEGFRGVGPKTARLIESGFKGLDAQVHVCDIWLQRTLTPVGVFRPYWNLDRHYDRFEDAFLQYARHGGVAPVALDQCIWLLARKPPEASY